tara:strand:- start:16752 stop:17762 length:1011 start_codon:yes stop_codon:yes gene_type:complete
MEHTPADTKHRVFITGTAGFIGFRLARLLLAEGHVVCGLDAVTDYYDVTLKERHQQILLQNPNFQTHKIRLEDADAVMGVITDFNPTAIVHLAAQAGVRYSLENPRAYLDSNITRTFNIMEAARVCKVGRLLMASTSSVYGANTHMPFDEKQKVDTPLTFYAATKKANEAMSHSYAHLWNLPTTMSRFFTVYGPWGRPDMALFKFTKGIIERTPIDIYNHGDMYRDFTYVEDLVRGIRLLIDVVPERAATPEAIADGDSLSPVAPWRVVNIGNSDKVRLMDYIQAIEDELGQKAIPNFMDMQTGDVPATWANAALLQSLTGYQPQTDVRDGLRGLV